MPDEVKDDMLTRYADLSVRSVHGDDDKEMREFDAVISTETEVLQYDWRTDSLFFEVLGHEADEVDMEFIGGGKAPFLKQHRNSVDGQIGVIISSSLENNKVTARIKLSRNEDVSPIWNDIKDGIRSAVSVGYIVSSHVQAGSREGLPILRAVKWRAVEASLVSMGADENAEIKRKFDDHIMTRDKKMPSETKLDIDIEKERKDAAIEERARVSAINDLGAKYKMEERSKTFISDGKTVEEFRAAILDEMPDFDKRVKDEVDKRSNVDANGTPPINSSGINDSHAEAKRYSLINVMNHLQGDTRSDIGYEAEVNQEMERIVGKRASGMYIPHGIMQRDITNVNSGASIVDTVIQGEFIDFLRARSVLAGAGARILTGLQGNVSFSKKTGETVGVWVTENGASTESTPTFGVVTLSPKTIATYVDVSKLTLQQSSHDVEALVQDDLLENIGLAIDSAGLTGGGTNEPIGITGTGGIAQLLGQMTPNWADVVELETNIFASNADGSTMRYILHPTLSGTLKTTVKDAGSGMFIFEDGQMNGYNVSRTTQLAAEKLVFGDFSQMLIGMWGGIDLVQDIYTQATTRLVRFVAHQFADIKIRHDEGFAWNDTTTSD